MSDFKTADVAAARADGLAKGKLLGTAVIVAALPTATVFADGTTNGFSASDHAWRFNNTIDNQFLHLVVGLPWDFDYTAPVDVVVGARITDDSADNDVVAVLTAYVDGGSDVGPASTQVITDATAYQDVTFTIPASAFSSTSRSLHLGLRFSNDLDVADGLVRGLVVRYSRASGVS